MAGAGSRIGETADWWYRRENGTPLTVAEWQVIARSFTAVDAAGMPAPAPLELLCGMRDDLLSERRFGDDRRAGRDVSEPPLDLGEWPL